MLNIIDDRENLLSQLFDLNADSKPLFGKMSAQHMVEHLTFSVSFSNGKKPQKLYETPERAQKIKSIIIYSPKEIQYGAKAPMLGEEPIPLINLDIPSAIRALKTELKDFDHYFENNPDSKPIQPMMGELDHNEWIILHGKHFAHHFRQFGLI